MSSIGAFPTNINGNHKWEWEVRGPFGSLDLQKLLFPFIFGGNEIPERNLITKIIVNSTTTIFRG
jgi:hypothetical protein